MRIGREAGILGVLLIAFIAATAFFTQTADQTDARKQPSSHNPAPGGTRALFRLLQTQSIPARRLEAPLTQIPPDTGLIVMVEPFQRPLQDAEFAALQSWLNGGGTLLFVVRRELGDAAPSNLAFEEAAPAYRAATQRPAAPTTQRPNDPLTRDIQRVTVDGSTIIEIEKPEKVRKLITAGEDAYAVTWREQRGRVVMVSSAVGLTNGHLRAELAEAADNSVFFVNIAQAATGPARPAVLFDEYRQGYGERQSVDRTLWSAIGPGLRAAALYLLFGFLLLVYTLNRRLGTVRELPSMDNRPSTDYIASMAALYQRSGAGLLALETILHDFVRDLASRLEMEPTEEPGRLAAEAGKRLNWDAPEVESLLRRCIELLAIDSPADHAMEQEITTLARRLHHYRMDLKNRTLT